MSEKGKASAQRDRRRAATLRENLKRRKAQARGRNAGRDTSSETSPQTPADGSNPAENADKTGR